MPNRKWVLPGMLGFAGIAIVFTTIQLAGALGRIGVLSEEADSAEVATEMALAGEAEALAGEAEALAGEAEARMALATSFEEAAQEKEAAALRQAEAQATLILQEAEGEAAFRRLHDFLEGAPLAQRLAEEMDAEFRVQGMLADAALRVSASSLLTAQNRIGILEGLILSQDSTRDQMLESHAVTITAHGRTVAAFEAEVRIKDRIISEQQSILAPSFLRKIFYMPEVALVGVALGMVGCVLLCP
jgi:hypothetical protein